MRKRHRKSIKFDNKIQVKTTSKIDETQQQT